MKVCPVCGAVAFDDAVMCFGCLHRFGEESVEESEGLEEGLDDARPSTDTPGILIRLAPNAEGEGVVTWSCTVELEQPHSSVGAAL